MFFKKIILNLKENKKRAAIFLFVSFFVFFSYFIFLYFLNNSQNLNTEAYDANKKFIDSDADKIRESFLYIEPNVNTVEADSSFSLSAMINPGEYQVTAVELHIAYDSEKIRLDNVDVENSPFQTVLQVAQINNDSGQASIVLGIPPADPLEPVVLDAKVASFDFYALSPGASTDVFIAASSMAAALGEAGDIISQRLPARINISQ
jgi:hypothetical protein